MNNDAPGPLLRPAAALPTLSSSSSSLTKAYPGWHSGVWSWNSRC